MCQTRLMEAGLGYRIMEMRSNLHIWISRATHRSRVFLRLFGYLHIGQGIRGSGFKKLSVTNPEPTDSRKTKVKRHMETNRLVTQESGG